MAKTKNIQTLWTETQATFKQVQGSFYSQFPLPLSQAWTFLFLQSQLNDFSKKLQNVQTRRPTHRQIVKKRRLLCIALENIQTKVQAMALGFHPELKNIFFTKRSTQDTQYTYFKKFLDIWDYHKQHISLEAQDAFPVDQKDYVRFLDELKSLYDTQQHRPQDIAVTKQLTGFCTMLQGYLKMVR